MKEIIMNVIIIFGTFCPGLVIAFLVDKSFGLHPAYAFAWGFTIALIAVMLMDALGEKK